MNKKLEPAVFYTPLIHGFFCLIACCAIIISSTYAADASEEANTVDYQVSNTEVQTLTSRSIQYSGNTENLFETVGNGIAEEIGVVSMSLPDVDSSVKTYMDYKTITSKSSIQYKLQQKASTNKYGFRELDGNYMIALGTYYSDHAGALFRITLKNGTVFNAITGDVKADCDTNSTHQHRNGNVVEFVVETSRLADDARIMGDVSYTPNAGLMGPIAAIEYIGEFDF